jgi:hypothetical protein
MLVGDIQCLPETQRTALVLREMDALSYEQIAEAMETTVPSVKSLLVRARVSLAEAAQARMLSCEEVRIELGEVAEGLRRRPGPLVRRHLRTCERCAMFKTQLGDTSKALAALLPIGFAPLALLRKLAIVHLGHSAGAGSSASGASAAGQAAAVGSTAAAGATAVISSTGGGFLSASVGAIATKAAAGLAAAALVTAGAVEVDQPARAPAHHHAASSALASVPSHPTAVPTPVVPAPVHVVVHHPVVVKHPHKAKPVKPTPAKAVAKPAVKQTSPTTGKTDAKAKPKVPPGRTQTQTDATVLAQSATPTVAAAGSSGATSTTSTTTTPASTTPTTTSTTPAPPSSDPTTTTTTDPTSTTPAQSTDPCTSDPADPSCPPPSGGVAPPGTTTP